MSQVLDFSEGDNRLVGDNREKTDRGKDKIKKNNNDENNREDLTTAVDSDQHRKRQSEKHNKSRETEI